MSLFGNCRSTVTLFSTQMENVRTPLGTRTSGPKIELVARLLPRFAHLAGVCTQPGIKVILPDGTIAVEGSVDASEGQFGVAPPTLEMKEAAASANNLGPSRREARARAGIIQFTGPLATQRTAPTAVRSGARESVAFLELFDSLWVAGMAGRL